MKHTYVALPKNSCILGKFTCNKHVSFRCVSMALFAQKYLCVWWTNSQVAEPAMHCAKTVGLLEHQLLTMHCTGTSHVHSIFAQQLAEIFKLVSICSRSCHVRSCRFKKVWVHFNVFPICFRLFLQLHSWQMKARRRRRF